ncbi:hypothetical protein MCUN1_002646 [Malassezia cuniculi]|uniref:G protein gamma domain-containing protein n=1 Tax=Malassezia cuniculi TaxID=948313 RepID=A0AAF0EV95_9BASI|nr:hypothetical protein MCUN1_002646 [Malassezia cuniculi]
MSQAQQRAAALEDKIERLERGNGLMRRELEQPETNASQSAKRIVDYSANKRDPLVHAEEKTQSTESAGCCTVM